MPAEVKRAVRRWNRYGILSRIGTVCGLCFMGFAGVACAMLSLLSLFTTAFFKIDGPSSGVSPDFPSITEELVFKYGLPSLAFIAGFAGLSAGMVFIVSATRTVPLRYVARFVTVFSLAASLVWVLSLNSCGAFWYNDSRSLVDSAGAFLNGDYSLFDVSAPAHGAGSPDFYSYYSWYPFQCGAMLWFTLVFLITGVGNIAGFQVINAFLSAGIAWAIWKIGEQCGLSGSVLRCEAVLLIFCVPLFTSSAFVYPNTAGLFLVLIALLFGIRALQASNTRNVIALAAVSYLVSSAAMMVKGTVVVFVIAFTLTLMVAALIRHRYWLIALGLLFFFAARTLSSVSVLIVETVVGQDFGSGLPQLSWVAMGLDVGGSAKNPGWWNDNAITAYQQTGGNPDEQSTIARQSILDSLATFLQNPVAALEFFRDKLSSEWSEPTFGTFHYAHLTETQDPGPVAKILFGSAYDATIRFENVYQSVVYVFATVGVVTALARWKRVAEDDNIGMTLLSLCILGGFGCFLLWEAKSVYTLPFFLMLIPLASSGLNDTGHLFLAAYRRLRSTRRDRIDVLQSRES